MKLKLLSASLPIPKIQSYLSFKDTWFFAGIDIKIYKSLRDAIGKTNDAACSPKEFSDHVLSLRKKFVDWLEEIHEKYGDDIDHWVSALYFKHPYGENLFLSLCQLEWILNYLGEKSDKDLAVISENIELLLTTQFIANKMGIPTTFDSGINYQINELISGKIYVLKEIARRFVPLRCLPAALDFFQTVFFFFCRWLFVKLILPNRGINSNSQIQMVLDTYLYPDSIQRSSEIIDRHFAHLHSWLKNNGIIYAIYPELVINTYRDAFQIFIKIRNSSVNLLVLEQFITISDIFFAFFHPVRFFKKFELPDEYYGIPINKLMVKEWWKLFINSTSFMALLKYRFVFRLKQKKFETKTFLTWYENQLTDKANVAGFKKFFPDTRIIGVQHVIPFYNYLSSFVTEKEVKFHVSPDILIVPGQIFVSIMKTFQKGLPVRIGGAFRYDYLRKIDYGFRNAEVNKTEKACLILLPYSVKISLDVLEISVPGLRKFQNNGGAVLIKCHPNVSHEIILAGIRGREIGLNNFQFTRASFCELFSKIDAVISTATGGILEALCFGLPLVLVGSVVGLELLPIIPDEAKPLVQITYTEEDIDLALNRWRKVQLPDIDERKNIGKKVLEMSFSPLDERDFKANFI